MSNDLVLLVARILLVLVFVVTGLGFLSSPSGIAGYFGSLGIPAAGLVVWLVIALKLIGAAMIIVGYRTAWAAYALAAFCIAAPLIGHMNWADQNEMITFLKDFSIAGGLLLLSVVGPGAYSLDARRA